MRASATRLLHSSIRLSDVAYPASSILVARTRLAYLHIDNLISFAKRDRDGRVDAYLLGYLPDELILLFFQKGEVVTAAGIGAESRTVLPIQEAIRRLKSDPERGEAAYCAAPTEQLQMMYHACAAPAEPWLLDSQNPEQIFPRLATESFGGGLEIISNGRVNYLTFDHGRYVNSFLYGRPETEPISAYIQTLFSRDRDGVLPALAVSGMTHAPPLPAQALPSQVRMYREVFARIAHAMEVETPADGVRRVDRATAGLIQTHPALASLLPANTTDPASLAISAGALTAALAGWAAALLGELEIVSPGSGPRVLRETTRDHRHVLQGAGFYDQFPWSLNW
jgi:hypothetical protein